MNSRLQENEELFRKIKLISNFKRFQILLMTQDKEIGITELSSLLKLSYTKCADYVSILEKSNLIAKIKEGKKTKVKSNVKFTSNRIEF